MNILKYGSSLPKFKNIIRNNFEFILYKNNENSQICLGLYYFKRYKVNNFSPILEFDRVLGFESV